MAEEQQGNGGGELLLIPLQREELRRIKAVKFSDAEIARIEKFQEWLSVTINPETGKPYIPRNEFSAPVQFCLNLAIQYMGNVAEQMVRAEEGR